jgi:hypothetical protein
MEIGKGIDRFYQTITSSKLRISTLLRWYVVISIFIRIVIPYFFPENENLPIWLVLLAIYALYSIWITYYPIRHPINGNEERIFLLQLFVDTTMISLAYYLTDNFDSDLYLNYALPILIVLEHNEKPHLILFYYFLISLAFLFTQILLDFSCGCGFPYVISHAFIPRFTLTLLLLSYVILDRMAKSSTTRGLS